MKRSRVLGVLSTLVVAAGVPAAVLTLSSPSAAGAAGDDGTTADPAAVAEATSTTTASVVRRDLEEREELDGTLAYPAGREVALGAGGTITGLAPEGSFVGPGGVLGEVDGRPVALLHGDRPMWRTLGVGVDDGADVRQLEENLVALGFATAANVGPNDRWSAATTAAVKRWQESLGLAETGVVELGSAVFLPGSVRVGSHLAEIGDPAGGPALALTGLDRIVTVDLDADRQGLLAVGQEVDVELPDGSLSPGVVLSVATVVDAPDPSVGGPPTIAVVVALTDVAAAPGLDQAPVDVQVVSVQATGALTVPVDALLALAEGGYAVERPDGTLVGVTLGAFADGFVEVTPTTGTLDEGDEVVVPA